MELIIDFFQNSSDTQISVSTVHRIEQNFKYKILIVKEGIDVIYIDIAY